MVDVSNKHKSITVGVSSNNGNTIVTANSDTSQYWANQAHSFADQSKESVQEAKNYAELANSYIEGFEDVVTSNTNNIITTSNDCINQIAENTGAAIDSINSTKTTILNDIEFVADGEKKEIEDLIDNGKDELKEAIGDVKVLTTLEIGDVGFTQMAIDESKGKRRVLNGQLIIQDQHVQFTKIAKDTKELNPELFCTESEWQTELTMSANGVCYKYVIDDEAGTIRLPKYPDYLDLSINTGAKSQTVSVYGTGKALGMTNGSVNAGTSIYSQYQMAYQKNSYNANIGTAHSGANNPATDNYQTWGVVKNASTSGLTGRVTVPAVESEKIKGAYFIQVATGAETEDNITNTIELNNPFSLLDYKYSEYELNNLSWLRSESQYNSKAIYPAVYDLLLKIYNGTETKAGVSVKSTEVMKAFKETGSTGYYWVISTDTPKIGQPVYATNGVNVGNITSITNTNGFTFLDISGTYFTAERNTSLDTTIPYTDYDFVLNTAEETFRLPVKVKQKFLNAINGNMPVVGNGKALGLTNGSANAGLVMYGNSGVIPHGSAFGLEVGSSNSGSSPFADRNRLGITTDSSKSGIVAKVSQTEVSGLYLYFYVGETVQNANLVNIGRIQETMVTRPMVDGQWVYKYQVLSTALASGTYTLDLSNYLPNDGYVYEILCRLDYDQTTDGTNVYAHIQSDIIPRNYLTVGSDNTFGGVNMTNSAIIPAKDYLKLTISSGNMTEGGGVQVFGYRRVGTNL